MRAFSTRSLESLCAQSLLPDELVAVDTTGIAPMAHAQDIGLPLRDDAVTEPDRHALYQSVAPSVEDGLYLVPKVIE